ncbi:MAG: universal stress protein [Prochloraceae cyanobacterium]|nr:universal stress protein [Prochloraceae cyanobacterium]
MLKTIVVALDNSDLSEQVIDSLINLRIEPETKIVLSHVLPSPEATRDLPPDRPHQSRDSLYQEIEQQLQAYQSQLPGSMLEITEGDAASEIIRLSNIHQADLIVLGTRGLKGIKRIVEDSVSSQVVAEAPCSVLVVKPKQV